MMSKKKWVSYFIVAMVASVFFIYFLFPSDAVRKYIVFKLSSAMPDYTVTIEKIKPVFPPGIKAVNLSVYYHNNNLFDVEQVRIIPGITSFFGQKAIFFFDSKAYGGIVKGQLVFAKDMPFSLMKVKLDLSDIRIGDIKALKEQSYYQILGTLNGNVEYCINEKNLVSGKASFVLSDCQLDIKNLFVKLKPFQFKQIKGKMKIDNNICNIEQCTIKGDQANCNIKGEIIIAKPFPYSMLNIYGNINPNPEFIVDLKKSLPLVSVLLTKKSGKNGYPFKVEGTFDNPDFLLK